LYVYTHIRGKTSASAVDEVAGVWAKQPFCQQLSNSTSIAL
jgi:hypothetical protein